MRISGFVLLFVLLVSSVPAIAQTVNPKDEIRYSGGSWKLQESAGWQNLAPSGTWWRNPSYATKLSLTTEQQKRMDDVFQQYRLRLIDLNATLDKEEFILEPMLEADRLDEIKVGAQIDKIANARAELEKANARMLLGIRQVLTPEQWSTLHNSTLIGARIKYFSKEEDKADLKKLLKPKP